MNPALLLPVRPFMRALLLLAACAVFSLSAVASTLNYDESSYPGQNFPGTGNPFLGYLGVGSNTISGWIWHDTGGEDVDTFSVAPLAGTEVISEEFKFTDTRYNTNISITEPINGTTAISSDVDTTLTAILTGMIDVSLQGTAKGQCTGPGGTPPCTYTPTEYTITYNVQDIPSATPEPPGAVLCGTGLMLCGVGLVFRRRAGLRATFA